LGAAALAALGLASVFAAGLLAASFTGPEGPVENEDDEVSHLPALIERRLDSSMAQSARREYKIIANRLQWLATSHTKKNASLEI
jgi:hypothetical protein